MQGQSLARGPVAGLALALAALCACTGGSVVCSPRSSLGTQSSQTVGSGGALDAGGTCRVAAGEQAGPGSAVGSWWEDTAVPQGGWTRGGPGKFLTAAFLDSSFLLVFGSTCYHQKKGLVGGVLQIPELVCTGLPWLPSLCGALRHTPHTKHGELCFLGFRT